VIAMLEDVAQVESAPGAIINRDMSMILAPRRA
jgi:hypothetical protein